MTEKPVKIRVTSSHRSFNNEFERSKMATDGVFKSEDTCYTLAYDESLSDGDVVHTVFSFEKGSEDNVFLQRTGAVDMSCEFSQGKRFRFAYGVGSVETEFTVFGKHVKNTISENGGSLFLEYLLESNGAVITECKMSIRAIV